MFAAMRNFFKGKERNVPNAQKSKIAEDNKKIKKEELLQKIGILQTLGNRFIYEQFKHRPTPKNIQCILAARNSKKNTGGNDLSAEELALLEEIYNEDITGPFSQVARSPGASAASASRNGRRSPVGFGARGSPSSAAGVFPTSIDVTTGEKQQEQAANAASRAASLRAGPPPSGASLQQFTGVAASLPPAIARPVATLPPRPPLTLGSGAPTKSAAHLVGGTRRKRTRRAKKQHRRRRSSRKH